MPCLIHYTNLINALKILYSKEIMLGNVSESNDLLEKECIDGCDTVFAFCCSAGPLNAPLWLSYSGRKDGAAIIFSFKSEALFSKLLKSDKYNIKFCKIQYSKEYFEEVSNNPSTLFEIKDSRFEYENEYRFYVHFEEIIVSYRIKCKLNLECLDKITLVVNQQNAKMVDDIVKKFNLPCEVSVEANDFIQ